MNQNTDIALKQAFDLIEGGNLEDARALLRPILEIEKDNADVWWLYSHAVTDPDTARLALNNVLRIDPDYPDARDLLDQLVVQQKSEPSDGILEIDKDPSFIPAMPSSVPGIIPIASRDDAASKGFPSPDDLPEDLLEDEEPEPFYRRPLFYMPLITLLLIVALAIVIVKPFAANSPAPAITATTETAQTSAVETPTSESIAGNLPILTSIPTIGVETATSEAVASNDLSAVSSAFTGITLASDGAQLTDTSLGKTLNVSVCTSAGKEMRELLPKAMELLAKASPNHASQVQGVAVKLQDCAANSTLLWIGANIADAAAFAGGTLTDKDFQAKWQPVK